MLVEGDNVAKAIVDLVGNLNIRKLVIGTTQSNLRYHVINNLCNSTKLIIIIIIIEFNFLNVFTIWMSRKPGSRRQNAIADMVLKDAQESCDIKIICEGREVIDQMLGCTSPHSRDNSSSRGSHEEDESRGIVPLKRLMPNPLWLFRSRFLSPR